MEYNSNSIKLRLCIYTWNMYAPYADLGYSEEH